MNFCDIIHILGCIFICVHSAGCLSNADLNTVESGNGEVTPCAIGFKLYTIVNNTSAVDYDVELVPDQCCLEGDSGVDCSVFPAIGSCAEVLPKGSVKTLKLIVPILDPYERKGYCLAYLDSKAVHRKKNAVTMRDNVKIPFDTRLKNYKSLPVGVKRCKGFDEDPLNQCQAVDCEVFYNGKKSFYDRIQKRCTEVPPCVSEEGEIPNTVLNPISNKCIVDDPINNDDLDYIKSLKHNSNERIVKDIVIIKKYRDGPYNLSEFENMHDNNQDQMYNMMVMEKPKIDEDSYITTVLCLVGKNKSSVAFLFFVILLQCGLICTMIYFSAKRRFCNKSTVLEKKYFNYKQDASITTPLIGITTADTETTCQFTSESSHIDRKIQCYKACQKETAKISLSDDILSKCLNRRNWDRKQVKSEAVDTRNDNSKTFDTLYMNSTKKDDQKVVIENDKDSKKKENKKKVIKSIVKKIDSKRTTPKNIEDEEKYMSEREIQCLTYKYKDSKPKIQRRDNIWSVTDTGISEREIRCHSYNHGMTDDNDSLRVSSHSYSEIKNTNKQQIYTATVPKASSDVVSIGRQASAQASFSNDSIDDYLSERGMLFLTGENISKYSFSDASIKSSVTSKTSKHNIIKQVLSYLKRDKHGPASDPGVKLKEEVNLELIHMSKATMYSSSNNGTDCLRNNSKTKDSRTSL